MPALETVVRLRQDLVLNLILILVTQKRPSQSAGYQWVRLRLSTATLKPTPCLRLNCRRTLGRTPAMNATPRSRASISTKNSPLLEISIDLLGTNARTG